MASHTNRANIPEQISFYKVHGAPIAKVLLMATFVYQVAYWGWVKLEKDEEKANRSGEFSVVFERVEFVLMWSWCVAEIEGLEQKLKGLVGETRGK